MKKRILSALMPVVLLLSAVVTIPTAAAELPFKDVEHSWYYDAVAAVYEAGAMKGKAPDMFEPFASMTRAEFVQLLANLSHVNTKLYVEKCTFSSMGIIAQAAFVGRQSVTPSRNPVSYTHLTIVIYSRAETCSALTARSWKPIVPSYDKDRKSTRLNSSHSDRSRMPSSA